MRARVAACGIGGALLALPLHVWVHKAVPGLGVLAYGAVGGAVPALLLGPIWRDLPDFLGRALSAAVAGIGVLLIVVSTIAVRGPLYALLRRDELLAATLSLALISVGVAALVETHRRLAAVITSREQELAAERRAAIDARLRALQAQIRPHFLFNTFNALSELIHADADAAEDLVTDLAHLLRYSLRSGDEGDVTLGEELDAVRRYLRIEKARLGDRLTVEYDMVGDVESERIPALILQPLVENAVLHAVAPRSEGGTIVVRARATQDEVVLEVHDDGPGIPKEVLERAKSPGDGHEGGLANVARRLALRFENASLATHDEATIEVRLPRARDLSRNVRRGPGPGAEDREGSRG